MPADLRHLRSFVAVAEERHIGRAAQRLFITQPALSRQMQQLEHDVGASLLLRTSRGVELTEPGRDLLERARVAVEATEEALAVNRAPRGRLVLGLPVAGGRELWFGVANAYADRYPEVDVEIREAMSEPLLRQLLAGEIDVAVVMVPRRLESLVYQHIHDEPLAVWVHHEHELASRSAIELADLHGHRVTLVAGSRAGLFNGAIRSLFDGTGVEPEFVETAEAHPPSAGHAPGFLAIAPRLDYPAEVVRVPLVPPRTIAFDVVHRVEARRAAVTAFAPFGRRHLDARRA